MFVPIHFISLFFTSIHETYNQIMSNHIFIIQGILDKTALDPKEVDYLYYGTVIQESKTSNIAREASMGAGIPISVPSHTVTQACISSVQALTTGAEKILAGQADVVLAGGEYISS